MSVSDDGEIPIVEPPFEGDVRRSATVAGVLLAAGRSERFERGQKLLADLDGTPLVAHAARSLAGAGLDRAVAVVAPGAGNVRSALAGSDLEVIEAAGPETELSDSVAAGVRWARERTDAVLFALGDMPRVDPETIDRLAAAYCAGAGSALAAGYHGTRGNPVLFGARHFGSLTSLSGDRGGRSVLLDAEDAAIVETADPGTLVDVDTVADLEAIR